jgi:hypothetical protein
VDAAISKGLHPSRSGSDFHLVCVGCLVISSIIHSNLNASVQCESDLEKKLFGYYIGPAELVSSLSIYIALPRRAESVKIKGLCNRGDLSDPHR